MAHLGAMLLPFANPAPALCVIEGREHVQQLDVSVP
jgi:hypothetical protein